MKLVVFPLLIFSFIQSSPVSQQYQLIFVQAVWRHGDRTPQNGFKIDTITESDWIKETGNGYGQLTPLGIKQQVNLGKAIRRRYIEKDFQFLPENYDPTVMHIRTTDTNRTFKSAEANMLGMYPDGHNFTFYRTIGYKKDCAGAVFCKCPRVDKLYQLSNNLEENKIFEQESEVVEILNKLTENYGETITLDNIWRVFDNLNCQRVHFPERLKEKTWYNEELYQKILNISYESNEKFFGLYETGNSTVWNGIDLASETKKLRVSALMEEISKRLRNKLEDSKDIIKYHAYSAHDASVFAVLSSLELHDHAANSPGEWPNYAAAVFIELYQNQQNEPCFKLVYRKDENSNFEDLTKNIPQCINQEYCPFKIFEEITKTYKIEKPILEYCQQLP